MSSISIKIIESPVIYIPCDILVRSYMKILQISNVPELSQATDKWTEMKLDTCFDFSCGISGELATAIFRAL